jgi:tRNA dimethylallyltransferase
VLSFSRSAKKERILQIVKYLIVIGGATATGKTALAIQLARHFDTEILSADSRQFYRGMSIGTAKPSTEELAAAPHHFIDSLEVTDPYSVGDFERDALQCLDTIYQKKSVAIVSGGSGLYLRTLCEGMDQFPEISESVKNQVDTGIENGSLSWLQMELERLDPTYYAQVDQQNPARLRRALEVCLASGQPYSAFRGGTRAQRNFQPIYILLDLPRPHLYARIDARVDTMIAAGLEDEARALLPYRHLSALRTVGYEEFFDCFDGNITRAEAIEKIQQHSRNYAKRQATWFRKHGNWQSFAPEQILEIIQYLEKQMLIS